MDNNKSFGHYLKHLLKSRSIKPQQLADWLNTDHSLVRKWLAGSRVPPLKSGYYDLICQLLALDREEQLTLKKAQINSVDEKVVALTGLLQEAEDRADGYQQALVSLLNAIPEIALLVDADHKIVAANQITVQRLGITEAEVVGRNAYAHLPSELADSRREIARKVFVSGKPVQVREERDNRHTLYSLYPVKNSAGLVTKIAMCATDITRIENAYAYIRENEERLRLMFENSMDPIFLTKPDGTILAANSAACCFLHMTEQEICAAGRSGVVDPGDENLAPAVAVREATGRARARLTFVPRNGPKRTALVTSVSFRDSKNELRAYVMIHPEAP